MQTMTTRQGITPDILPAGLSPIEKAKVSALMRKMGRDDFLLYACRLALGVKPTFRTTRPTTKTARKAAIVEKIQRNSGVTLRKSAFLDGWLDQVADLPDPHPDIADMTDDELLSFVNAEVKQYRAEQRALESTQASH